MIFLQKSVSVIVLRSIHASGGHGRDKGPREVEGDEDSVGKVILKERFVDELESF